MMFPGLVQPSVLNSMNIGISVMISGSIIVPSSIPKKKSRPGQRSRANEYATIEDDSTTPSTVRMADLERVDRKRREGQQLHRVRVVAPLRRRGNPHDRDREDLGWLLSDEETIHSVGPRNVIRISVIRTCRAIMPSRSIVLRRDFAAA